ncbi:MAG: tRNA uridine-5-carboxymethylaminomethyl(34) synthesis GTPase MnmE [Bacteroidales bacterium]|nr:tRNA uridine-5-carboxymethylaminomethyl(34) synthesis GTPase MnmE [Bacteroidales bacterium]
MNDPIIRPGEFPTICAPATPQAVSALAVIRMSGPRALEIAGKVFRSQACGDLTKSEGYRTWFGTVKGPDGEFLDQVLLSVFRAPHSYTGEDSVEFSCHGSLYIRETLLRVLIDNGAVLAGPGEFTQRAFMNGKMDLTQAEAVADLIASENRTTHKLALDQMRGTFSKELAELREQLLNVASLMELELDFAEEDVEFANRDTLRSLMDKLLEHMDGLCESFRMGNTLKKGVPVAIAGVVNAGKSTLLNALLGEEKALVTPIAGTTRDTIEDVLVLEGIPFRFIDTAGLRSLGEVDTDSQQYIEKLGVERSLETIRMAPVLLLVLDVSQPETYEQSLQLLKTHRKEHTVLIVNKIDSTSNKDVALDYVSRTLCNMSVTNDSKSLTNKLSILPVSARDKTGLEAVKNWLIQEIRPVLDTYSITLTNVRHYQELYTAGQALLRVREGLDASLSTDLLTPDLRIALHHIGSITGEISTEDILGEIFSRFCIGK